MKSSIVLLAFSFLSCTITYSQFSLETGLAIPVGEYAATNQGEASLGFSVRPGWDLFIGDKFGIATGLIVGTNRLKNNAEYFNDGSWSNVALELGLLYQLSDDIKIKGMLLKGVRSSPIHLSEEIIGEDLPPSVTFQSSTFGTTSNSTSNFGIDLRFEYQISKFFVSTNFMYYESEFTFFENYSDSTIKKIGVANLGIGVGYRFGL